MNHYSSLRRYSRLRPRALKAKRGKVADPAFLAFVRRQPCLIRGRHRCAGPVDPHHVGHCGQARRNDRRTVPLCRAAHDEAQLSRDFEARYGVDFERTIRRLNAAYKGAATCPECDNDALTFRDYDFGVCPETGYHDAGEMFLCLECGAKGDAQDLTFTAPEEKSNVIS